MSDNLSPKRSPLRRVASALWSAWALICRAAFNLGFVAFGVALVGALLALLAVIVLLFVQGAAVETHGIQWPIPLVIAIGFPVMLLFQAGAFFALRGAAQGDNWLVELMGGAGSGGGGGGGGDTSVMAACLAASS